MGTGRRRNTTDGDLRKVIKKGSDAELKIESLKSYFEELEDNILKKWKDTRARDNEDRELLWFQLQSIEALKKLMEQEVVHGKQAQKKLEALNG